MQPSETTLPLAAPDSSPGVEGHKHHWVRAHTSVPSSRTNPTPPPWWEQGQNPAAAPAEGFQDPGKLAVAQLLLDPACVLEVEGISILGHLSAPLGSQHLWTANTQQWEFLTKLFSLSQSSINCY